MKKKSDLFVGIGCDRCGDALLNEFDDYAVMKIKFMHVDDKGDPQMESKKIMYLCQRCATSILTKVPRFSDFN